MKSSLVQVENNNFVNVHVYVFMNQRRRPKVRQASLSDCVNMPHNVVKYLLCYAFYLPTKNQ